MTNYNNVFGGSTLYSAQQTYLALNIDEDAVLKWPVEQQVGGDLIATSIMDITASVPGLTVYMPNAQATSTGIQTIMTNIGAESVQVTNINGTEIVTIDPGFAFVIYLYDNSTAIGGWRVFQLGALFAFGVSAAMAGAGLRANGILLDQESETFNISLPGTPISPSDRSKTILYSGVAGDIWLPDATSNLAGWFIFIRNISTDSFNLKTPSGDLIDGAALFNLQPSESTIIVFDGLEYYTIGYSQSLISQFTYTDIAVGGPAGTQVLTAIEEGHTAIRFTGVLTGDRVIEVSTVVKEYWFNNDTTGAFTFTVQSSAPATATVTLDSGTTSICYVDTVGNVLNATTGSTVSLPIAINQGGTGATTDAGARTNLGVPPTSLQIISGTGMTGGSTLTGNMTLNVNAGAGGGLVANANDLILDTSNTRNVAHSSVSILAGTGMTGGGTIAANRTLNVALSPNNGLEFITNQIAVVTDALRGIAKTALGLGVDLTTVTPAVPNVLTDLFLFQKAFDGSIASCTQSDFTNVITFPPGYINGFKTSASGLVTVLFEGGSAQTSDFGGGFYSLDTITSLTKDISAPWAEGDGLGGLASTLTLSVNTWYRLFVINKADGTTDYGMDSVANSEAQDLLADAAGDGYIYARRVGWVKTNGSSQIVPYLQREDYFKFSNQLNYTLAAGAVGGRVSFTCDFPPEVWVSASIVANFGTFSGGNTFVIITELDQPDTAPSSPQHTSNTFRSGSFEVVETGAFQGRTDIDGNLYYRNTNGDTTTSVCDITWVDTRGFS
jgi:hypothetical protein